MCCWTSDGLVWGTKAVVAVRPDKRTIDASSGDFIVYAVCVISSFLMTWVGCVPEARGCPSIS